MGFLNWLESTAYAEWILTSITGWPLMLGSHSLGLAILVGVVMVINLRMLGLYGPLSVMSLRRFLPVAWFGFLINLITGLSLFATQASYYITNLPFLTKMAFIIVGSVTLVYTGKLLKREGAEWDAVGTAPKNAILLAWGSIAFWALAIVTGRLIAYL